MYAHVNFVRNEQPRPELAEEALKLHKELLPKRQQQHAGYQGTLLLVDLVKGQAFDIDLYESQAHLQAVYQQGHYQGEHAQYEHLISEPPVQEVYEVAVHEIEMGRTLTHAAVTVAHLPPDKLDEGITIFRDSVVPELRQFKGFKGALLLVNRQTGKSMGIAVYDTEDEVQAVEHSGEYRRQLAKGAHLFSAPPSREVYEVAYYGLSK
jgi:quinol monooxygenase YgiN